MVTRATEEFDEKGTVADMELLVSIGLLVIASGLTWLGQWVVPRTRKNREKTEELEKKFKFFEERLNWAYGRIETLERRAQTQDERIDGLEAHVDDLYSSIDAEGPEASQRIRDRLKTKRPAVRAVGDPSAS
jgi:peptidoglycan hydrolase CwlO-like protein